MSNPLILSHLVLWGAVTVLLVAPTLVLRMRLVAGVDFDGVGPETALAWGMGLVLLLIGTPLLQFAHDLEEIETLPKERIGSLDSISVDERWYRGTMSTLVTRQGTRIDVYGRFGKWTPGQMVLEAQGEQTAFFCLGSRCLRAR